jgi:hypothetical protein
MTVLRLTDLTTSQRALVLALLAQQGKEKATPDHQRPDVAMEARQRHAERPPAA